MTSWYDDQRVGRMMVLAPVVAEVGPLALAEIEQLRVRPTLVEAFIQVPVTRRP